MYVFNEQEPESEKLSKVLDVLKERFDAGVNLPPPTAHHVGLEVAANNNHKRKQVCFSNNIFYL